MYCNEKKNYRNVALICTVLLSLKHCFYLGECVIKALKHVLCIVRLQEVILGPADPKYVSVSSCEKCPLTGGYKCSV